jgi:hypothetical protein
VTEPAYARYVRSARLTALGAVLVALVGGCDPSSSDSDDSRADRSAPAPATGHRHHFSYEARVIRGWLLALDRQDYDGAAYYFAPGALIDQGDPYRLRSEAAARTFNATLPCRADLIDLKHERKTVLASFRLRRGPGGPCSGTVQVRYTIRKGKFTAWHQLPQQRPPPGEPA